MSEFGVRLRKLRRDRDVTQRQLADFLGIQSAAVGKWENFESAYPNIPSLIRLADYFSVSIDYLLRGIQTVPSIEGKIANSSLTSSVVQSNVQGNIVMDEQALSPEIKELARIYKKLDGAKRYMLSRYAHDLEDAET